MCLISLLFTAKLHKMNFQNVATLSTLRQMSERLPITRPGLCEIDGFPEHKYAKFEGMKFLTITTEFNNKVASKLNSEIKQFSS